MHVKIRTRIAAVAAALAALALGAPLAGADTTWTKISTDYNANIVDAVARADRLDRGRGLDAGDEPVHERPERRQLHDLADAGRDRRRRAPRSLTGWAQIDYTHALFPAPGGGLQLIFNGIHSTTTGDPLNAMATTLRNADGSWAAPFAVSGSSSGADDRRALGHDAARRGLRHAGHRDLQRGRRPTRRGRPTRICSPSSAAAAATRRAWRSTAPAISGSRGTRTRREPRACTCSSSTR